MKVDTLVVMATNRGRAIAADQLDALRWSFERPFLLVIVDDSGTLPAGLDDGGDHVVIGSGVASRKRMSGFKNQEGIRHALELGVDFGVAFCLDDDALVIGKGLDAWALDHMEDGVIDLLGVEDRVSYFNRWHQWRALFEAWIPDSIGFTPHRETLFYAMTWMGRALCDEMHARSLLVPSRYEQWDLWPDVYLSWTAQALGFHAAACGTMDMPRPPLYANHPDNQRYGPQPWILHPDFRAFHSTRAVTGALESAVRAMYARRRHADC